MYILSKVFSKENQLCITCFSSALFASLFGPWNRTPVCHWLIERDTWCKYGRVGGVHLVSSKQCYFNWLLNKYLSKMCFSMSCNSIVNVRILCGPCVNLLWNNWLANSNHCLVAGPCWRLEFLGVQLWNKPAGRATRAQELKGHCSAELSLSSSKFFGLVSYSFYLFPNIVFLHLFAFARAALYILLHGIVSFHW